MLLIRVELPHLCAGVIAEAECIVQAAPILAWAVGQHPEDLTRWVLRREGRIEVVERWEEAADGQANKGVGLSCLR
jgi:hypothetical protein